MSSVTYNGCCKHGTPLSNDCLYCNDEKLDKVINEAFLKSSKPVETQRILNDHDIAKLVNDLTAIARRYHGFQSLRNRIKTKLYDALKPKNQ